ncbi:hypothetical protein QN224_30085 [Sinorhizobium sp. 8-89]|uniref:hypothetical protein n=1 Tax=Sinorhizobium sp. 7-81 TaxID=3049087 RepID=UPI0024C394BA|nr:hypothetical protein [Sinorhizobium sp. 7-81]MDK1389629.1 hypothetical protein [Sinorhizobium sp. 7-81]
MISNMSRPLGVLTTEGGEMLPRGYVGNPETFDFPIITETVAGAYMDRLWARDPSIEPALITAALRLVARGAIALTSDCGLLTWHQARVAASVPVPVVLSSLPLLPLLLRQLPQMAKVGVLSVSLPSPYDDEALGINDPADRSRVVFGGCEGAYEQSVKTRFPLKETGSHRLASLEADVVGGAARLRAEHPEVAAILLTCAAFPCVAPALRQKADLPVYSITDLCRLTMASLS